jgi:hypothetical protein
MTDERAFPTETQVQQFEAKLQAFCDGLTPEEQPMMRALLLRASGAEDVQGYGDPVPFSMPATVGGKPVMVSPNAGGDPTDSNAGKTGATIAAQPGGTPTGSGTITIGLKIGF